MLYEIIAPHFVCAIKTEKDIVVKAAPIVKYMMGWPFIRVYDYCNKKHWELNALT